MTKIKKLPICVIFLAFSFFLIFAATETFAQCGLPGTPPCAKKKSPAKSKTASRKRKRVSVPNVAPQQVSTQQVYEVLPQKVIRLAHMSPDIPKMMAHYPEDVKPKYLPVDRDQGYDIAIVDVEKAVLRDVPQKSYSSAYNGCVCLVGDNECISREGVCGNGPIVIKRDQFVILDRTPTNNWLNVISIETGKEGWLYLGHVEIYYTRSPKTSADVFEERRTESTRNPEVTVKNDTDKTLTFNIDGKTYTIGAGYSQTVYLTEGRFRYYVSAPRVYPIIGEKYLSRGYMYSWTFFIEKR
jgi:hypothetical protein